MELATGAMGTLLPKLGELLKKEYILQKSVKEGIRELKSEFEYMQSALEKVSEVPLDELDPQLKLWANDIRQLSYAIEDSLDSFLVSVEGLKPTKPHSFMGFVKKTRDKVIKFKIRHEIANDIKTIDSQVRRVKERYDRNKVHDLVANLGTQEQLDTRILSLYENVSKLVGIDKASDEIIKMLSSEDDDVSKRKFKSVSVVGFGSLGKTTLATYVYDKIMKEFDCASFVPVGRKPDTKKILRDILLELDHQSYANITESQKDAHQLFKELKGFLAGKRYLIVIDDIWDTTIWEIIKGASVDCISGSRIIATSRICEVAEKVGGVYNIKPLSDNNSKKLFNTRIFDIAGTTPDNQSIEVSDQILQKCGGVPLSIITIASLLVGKPKECWSKVYVSIGFDGHEDNEVVRNTRKVLSFSYYDLPHYLKPCLLHLSVFPEDYFIEKNSLIWKWVGEGLIVDKKGIGLFLVGESYFNQLVNKNMIQWVEPSNMRPLGGCRVHDMVLDIIRDISGQLNFTTLHGASSPCTSTSPVRRLAVHERSNVEQQNPMTEIEHVRSFNGIFASHTYIPKLSSFKVLRVLVLEECHFSEGGPGLEHLGKLLQLRYLGIVLTPVTKIPKGIGHDLKFLQTLDVRCSGIQELPPSIGELSKLMCLRASEGTRMMGTIGKLTLLEELLLHSVEKSPNFFEDLGNLAKVRVLEIHFDEIDESNKMALSESLRSLVNIQSLVIMCDGEVTTRLGFMEDWTPNSELRELALGRIILSRLPSWLDSFHVPHLSSLWLVVDDMEVKHMQILGRLPSLRCLFFFCIRFVQLSYTIGNDEFKNLRSLQVNKVMVICGEGALPMLHDLSCHAIVGKHDRAALVPRSMPSLQEVTYFLGYTDDHGAEEVEEAEAVLRQAAETHPNRPTIKIETTLCFIQIPGLGEEYDKEEYGRAMKLVVQNMVLELGRTVLALTTGKSYVDLRSMLLSVLDNSAILNLLSKLGPQLGIGSPLILSLVGNYTYSPEMIDDICNTVQDVNGAPGASQGSSSSSFDDLYETMQPMMPVVSQVIAGLIDERKKETEAMYTLLWQLGRTVMVATTEQRNSSLVYGEEGLQAHCSSILSTLLQNQQFRNLLSNLASEKWVSPTGSPLDLKSNIESLAYNAQLPDTLGTMASQSDSSNDWPDMMQQMMPFVVQVLAEVLPDDPPPAESSSSSAPVVMHDDDNDDDAKVVCDALADISLRENGSTSAATHVVTIAEETKPASHP